MKRPELDATCSATCFPLLPPDVLLKIFGLLSPRDLAAISMQDTYLRYIAGHTSLWQPLALARWPGANAKELYGGDWHRLYLSRAALPHTFPLAADRIRAVTAAQQQRHDELLHGLGGGDMQAAVGATGCCSWSAGRSSNSTVLLPQLAFEDVMQQTFNAGLACTRDRAVKRSSEWRQMKQDLGWWAEQRPEVVVAFIRSTHETLAAEAPGSWGRSGQRGSVDVPWRRSAVAFLQELGLLIGAHPSVINRITAEAEALDRAIRGGQREAILAASGPDGIPAGHWWFSRAYNVGTAG